MGKPSEAVVRKDLEQKPMISFENLRVQASDEVSGKDLVILRGLDLEVHKGDCVALIGESGSGKTTLLKVIGGLPLPRPGVVREPVPDKMKSHDNSDSTWPRRDGIRTSLIMQANRVSLPPHLTVQELLDINGHDDSSKRMQLLVRFGLVDSGHTQDELEELYCRDLSGGQKMRLNIALGLSANTELVLADEPTTGLDDENKLKVAEAFREFLTDRQNQGRTCIIVTHDLEFVDRLEKFMDSGTQAAEPASQDGSADDEASSRIFRRVFMFGGEIVEGSRRDPLQFRHPYALDLAETHHRVSHGQFEQADISGQESALEGPVGERCPYLLRCGRIQFLGPVQASACHCRRPERHLSTRCHFPLAMIPDDRPIPQLPALTRSETGTATPLISIRDLCHVWGEERSYQLTAKDFRVYAGETVFIEGPSGAGKTTLLRILAGLYRPCSGMVRFSASLSGRQDGQISTDSCFRRHVQYVFQESGLAYDPGSTTAELLWQAFDRLWPQLPIGQRKKTSEETLLQLGIPADRHQARAKVLSGGELKRVLLGRSLLALGWNPLDLQEHPVRSERGDRVLLIDELTSGYDPVVIDRVVSLLLRARDSLGLTLVISSHDQRFDQFFPAREKHIYRIEPSGGAGSCCGFTLN
jgi:ABC-type glutathione transport system ATPase component